MSTSVQTRGTHSGPSGLCWLAALIALVVGCCAAALAQQEDQSTRRTLPPGQQQTVRPRINTSDIDIADQGFSEDEESGMPALPAGRIIEILRREPELLAQVKKLVIERAADQGVTIPEDDLTDDVIFRRVSQDPGLRVVITNELKNRGYLSDEDMEALAASQSLEQQPSDVPRLSRRPQTGTTPPNAPMTGTTAPGRYETELPFPRRYGTEIPPPARSGAESNVPGQVTRRPPAAESAPTQDLNRPPALRRVSPYANIPALRDLYSQVPSRPEKLKRFGADLFLNTSNDLDSFPIDLPAGPDYVLGPGDGLNIDIWGSVSRRITQVVDREGRVALPEAGTLVVAGHTLADAQELVRSALSSQFRSVKVALSVTRLRTVRVYVVGDVQRPGAYDISSLSTPLNALYAAGGPTPRGSLRTVKHYRGERLVRDVDLYDLLVRGVRTDVERLEPGDTILVPPVGPQVAVAGMVHRPAIYELKSETSLAQAIDLAGGVLVSATLRQINVERIQAHQNRTMISLDLPDGNDPDTVKNLLGSFRMQDGDRVTIHPILPYSQQTVYLDGHVFRPGPYPFRKGMQVSDLVKSYQDLMPEPADHAEIIRLVPPDYRPETIQFKLNDLLAGDDPIELQPLDTVRIFGRYEIDPPRVSIWGEVLRPGEYPLAQNMTAAALVRMAGGLKRSAFSETADLASYVVQNGEKILTEHQTFPLAEALEEGGKADVVLKPGDVVTVRKLSGWDDIGASVTLNGEVLHPGKYGIREGERLSSLIRRAGGFRSAAYPAGTVLERVQVREIAEKTRAELIRNIQAGVGGVKMGATSNAQEQAALLQSMQQQQQQVLAALREQPATGRMVVRMSGDVTRWQNTADDIELRAGDVLTVPKRPSFVLVNGQVYNATAVTYSPGKTAAWYLRQAGGPTALADKGAMFIIRANGSVVSGHEGWFSGGVASARMQPGDSLVVPQKIIGGSAFWKGLMDSAQLTSSLAIAARVATSF